MKNVIYRLLQLFAEGSGGEGTASGETAADAGQTQVQEAAPTPPRMTWEQVKADPEYSAHMQSMVRERVKNIKQAQSDLQTLQPALAILARTHGLDPEKPDYAALSRAITERSDVEPMLQQHYQSLLAQSRQLSQKYPGFSLQQELRNPTFARLTAPGTGVSLEDAYYTVHRRDIQGAALQIAAQRTARQIADAIRAGGGRPEENGTQAQSPSVSGFDYRTASREQREALKQRIRLAGARGEKVYPG